MKEIAPNVYASTEYPGVNVGLIVMPKGAIAVDAPILPQDARAWRQQIAETARVPLLYVVLTDGHPDRLLSAGILAGSEEVPSVGQILTRRRKINTTPASLDNNLAHQIYRKSKHLHMPGIVNMKQVPLPEHHHTDDRQQRYLKPVCLEKRLFRNSI